MIANYHTHTFRCGHASGTEREYIERAIQNGIKIMGFSDHIPLIFPGGYESGYRVKMKDAQDYFEVLHALREEYRNDIEIHIGFEAEYYPEFFEQMLADMVPLGTEYLILGQHFIGKGDPESVYSGERTSDESRLTDYADCVIEAMNTGKFSYVAHPDLINFINSSSEAYERQARRICRASNETGVPLEINFLGIRDNRQYPNENFWKVAGEEGCTAVFGFDAHDAPAAFDGGSLPKALEIIEKYNLKLAETIELKKL